MDIERAPPGEPGGALCAAELPARPSDTTGVKNVLITVRTQIAVIVVNGIHAEANEHEKYWRRRRGGECMPILPCVFVLQSITVLLPIFLKTGQHIGLYVVIRERFCAGIQSVQHSKNTVSDGLPSIDAALIQ
jgi:hypothetical protein